MKTKLLIIISAILLTGCYKDGISTNVSDKNGIKIDLLFENDGCKVYRFYDGGRQIYYSDCRGQIKQEKSSHKTTTNQLTLNN